MNIDWRPKDRERVLFRVPTGLPDTACWPWLGYIDTSTGYGALNMRRVNGKWIPEPAHRLVWVLFYGAIPDSMCICHTCDIPICCNPRHLFLGTHKDNTADMTRKGRDGGRFTPGHGLVRPRATHCRCGHALTLDNLVSNGPNEAPSCKTCARRHDTERRRRKGVREMKPLTVATHCRNGHAMTPEIIYMDPRGISHCRRCKLESKRRHRA